MKMEREFSTKFHLLNSQRSSQDIIWSSSDSSDCENVFKQKHSEHVNLQNNSVKVPPRKRKRSYSRARTKKNISNLDVTFSDTIKEKNFPTCHENVPEATSKRSISPILNISQRIYRYTNANLSPILSSKNLNNTKNSEKSSPILHLHSLRPKHEVKVRKKLFNSSVQLDLTKEINTIINSTNKDVPSTKQKGIDVIDGIKNCNKNVQLFMTRNDVYSHDNHETLFEKKNSIPNLKINNSYLGKRITLDEAKYNHDTNSPKKEVKNSDILNKVESFFNNFNTQPLSQHSISEYESTQNSSKTSEEIDSISSTQEQSHSTEALDDNAKHIEITDKSKKIKYKKDGLAYRLHSLLKKQNANVSLWQHEQFLALNSNFIIPKGEYMAFRVQNVQFKYGIYLLEGKDVINEICYIIINSSIVYETQIKEDTILKLYKPFQIMNLENNLKFIVNVTKFEFNEIL